jgi:Winged helix DNA-binding domain
VQRGGGGAFVELAVTAYRRVGGQALDPHAAPLELRDDRRVGTQLAVGADAEHEPPGQLVEHLVEVLHRQRVALAAPPTADNPVGQDDQITRVLLAIDGEPAEAVIQEASHALHLPGAAGGQSRYRSVSATLSARSTPYAWRAISPSSTSRASDWTAPVVCEYARTASSATVRASLPRCRSPASTIRRGQPSLADRNGEFGQWPDCDLAGEQDPVGAVGEGLGPEQPLDEIAVVAEGVVRQETEAVGGPYNGLWSRTDGLARDQVTRALERRAVVQATLMRTTIHLVSARDYWPLEVAVREGRRAAWARSHREYDACAWDDAAARLRERLAETGPLLRAEIEAFLGKEFARSIHAVVPLVRVPPSIALWRHSAAR